MKASDWEGGLGGSGIDEDKGFWFGACRMGAVCTLLSHFQALSVSEAEVHTVYVVVTGRKQNIIPINFLGLFKVAVL